jgi:hypothetical protein
MKYSAQRAAANIISTVVWPAPDPLKNLIIISLVSDQIRYQS